jgi:hypothetical protein
MTPGDQQQRDAAARMLRDLAALPPPKRPGALALVVQALVRCGVPVNTTTNQEEARG